MYALKAPITRDFRDAQLNFEQIALWGVPVLVKAGIPSDADFPFVPPNGTMVSDETHNRLYVRQGGAWKYTALT